ncbi:MAG TPA: hypothetical protein VM715_07165 [Candidatus Acidoferrum sp.]|nr:hypothetical protein [Candidatus Acidoferrum sp.]
MAIADQVIIVDTEFFRVSHAEAQQIRECVFFAAVEPVSDLAIGSLHPGIPLCGGECVCGPEFLWKGGGISGKYRFRCIKRDEFVVGRSSLRDAKGKRGPPDQESEIADC